ncbi:MAG: uroporphyrinogen-III C-methyltransferase [Caldilineaceae bacterium]
MHKFAPPQTGSVTIVGAGPGDPDLMTVGGLHALQQADLVLYDRLVNAALLDEAPLAEQIYVGKAPGHHAYTQAQINQALIEGARQGKRVVRLKGGDPFVFGRGGEECQALAHAGIPFRVIPGISSALAAPAYAGIPVTQRNVATSFTVVTGHTTGADGIDWDGLPRRGTLVILMGMAHLAQIAAQIIAHGRAAHTPAAVIQQATTDAQQVVTGTLANIADRAQHLPSPAVIVVGEVVRLAAEIGWFEPEAEPAFSLDFLNLEALAVVPASY